MADNPFIDRSGELDGIPLAHMLSALLRYEPIKSKPQHHATIEMLSKHIDNNPADVSQWRALELICNLVVYGESYPHYGQFEFEVEDRVEITMREFGTSEEPIQDQIDLIWPFGKSSAIMRWITSAEHPREEMAELMTGYKTAREWFAAAMELDIN